MKLSDEELRDYAIILAGMGGTWMDDREDEPTRAALRIARAFASAWLDKFGMPKRAWRITVTVGGDTEQGAILLAQEMLDNLSSDGRLTPGGFATEEEWLTSGGSSEVTHDPTMTHDRYSEALDRHFEALASFREGTK